jgi:hypothetical protein
MAITRVMQHSKLYIIVARTTDFKVKFITICRIQFQTLVVYMQTERRKQTQSLSLSC